MRDGVFVSLVLCGALCGLGVASPAWAQVSPSSPTGLYVKPDDSKVMVLTTPDGLIVSADAGATWRWQCSASVGALPDGAASAGEMLVPAEGDPMLLIAGGADGIHALSPWDTASYQRYQLCNEQVERASPPNTTFLVSIAGRIFALDSSGIYRRSPFNPNIGASWSEVASNPLAGSSASFESITGGNPDPNNTELFTFFVGGTVTVSGVRTFELFRSDDSGATWGSGPVYTMPLAADERGAVVRLGGLGQDVLLTVKRTPGSASTVPERLMHSGDGGATFDTVLTSSHIADVLFDGYVVWVGDDQDGGFYRSTDAGASFAPVAGDQRLRVPCLAYSTKLVSQTNVPYLWVCGDDPASGWAIASSTDNGDTLDPFFGYCQVATASYCPAGSPVDDACYGQPDSQNQECQSLADLGLDTSVLAPQCPATTPSDGAACFDPIGGVPGTDPTPGISLCSVGVPGGGERGQGLAGLLVFGAALLLVRRRRSG